MLWLYFIGMLFTFGLCYGETEINKKPFSWYLWILAILAWPVVLGVVFAELINNTREEE